MNKNRIFLTALFVVLNSVLPISQSHAVGTGACTSTAGSDSGVVVANSGGFCYVAFTATGSNSWTAPSGVTSVDLLIIAGGGAGGSGAWGGGGGAGEVVFYSGYTVSSSSAKNISVGRGGVSGTATLTPASNRSEAGVVSWVGSASDVVAQGGGFGASYGYGSGSSYTTGGDGGSGGGGNEQNPASPGGASTKSSSGSRTGYGNIGGYGSTLVSGGGGGGAGTAGSNAASSTGGNGGNGTNIFASWLSAINSQMAADWQSATSTGYIAAGGGGGASATRGNGGSGGGGNGIINTTSGNGGSGIANTGSGGGGTGYYNSTAQKGGDGGSGLIIIKYANVVAAINSFNLTANATTATYRNISTININVNTQAKVTFKAKGVVIPGCKNKVATGSGSSFTATCNWKPSIRGQINLTADITPTGPWGNVSTSPLSIRVVNRSGTRA